MDTPHPIFRNIAPLSLIIHHLLGAAHPPFYHSSDPFPPPNSAMTPAKSQPPSSPGQPSPLCEGAFFFSSPLFVTLLSLNHSCFFSFQSLRSLIYCVTTLEPTFCSLKRPLLSTPGEQLLTRQNDVFRPQCFVPGHLTQYHLAGPLPFLRFPC